MVLLFVVGLAAVIIVILIAVFLSVRLGRSDDHDEPMGRPGERGRGRPAADDDAGWQDERAPRRSAAGASDPARGGQRPRPQGQDRRYRDGDDRRPERGQATMPGDHDYAQRRPGRYDSGPLEQPADARRPMTAGARRPGSGRDHGGRRAAAGPPESTTALYDTGPTRPVADDFPSEPLNADDFPSGEFPSGEFPPASQRAADAPTARYRTAGPHTDEFASGPLPEADFASGEFPAAGFPPEEMPAARTRPAPPKTDPGRDRSDSRRRPGKGQNAPKGRSRKRDDDDWPSMEWDKLTDEQYWAQLSSDKPLATTARSALPASVPRPAASKNGHAGPGAGGRGPVPATQPTAQHTRSRALPGRNPASPEREAEPTREAVPRREDTASRRVPAREAASRREDTASWRAPAREAVPRREDTASRRVPERETASLRETEREATPRREAVAERLPVRPRPQSAAMAAPRNDTPVSLRPDATPTPPAGQPSLAMLTSLASGPAGTLDDDPLTSPSFSQPTADSRSYRRNNAQASANGNAARADDTPAVAGYGSGGYAKSDHVNGGPANGGPSHRAELNGAYQDPAYTDPGYAYAPGAPAASPAVVTQPAAASQQARPAQPGGWYSAPTHTPARGNPYGSYVVPAPAANYPSTAPMGYQDRPPGAGLPGYSGNGSHRGYQEPAYDPARTIRYPAPTGNGSAGPPAPSGPSAHAAGAGHLTQPGDYPEAGYAEEGGYGNGYGQAPYADSYGAPTAGYIPGYPADGYPADQYGQDGYGGYPAGQG